jgi:hypothetical protein
MPSAKKAEKKDKKPKKEKPVSDDESDDDDAVEEEEEVEPEHVRRKRQRGRAAFLTLLRRVIAFIPLGIVLSRQPFMVKPRMSGVNAAKMRPLELAIVGAVQFAAGSPTFVRNPQLHVYLNATGRVLLTPFEYLTAQQSKRAMPAEKTWQGAYKKTAKGWGRLVDRDASVREMATAPQPNLPLIGSVLLVIGTMLCPLFGGVTEYLIVIGWCARARVPPTPLPACPRARPHRCSPSHAPHTRRTRATHAPHTAAHVHALLPVPHAQCAPV